MFATCLPSSRSLGLVFLGHRPIFFLITEKKLSQFGLMNSVMARFNITMVQITEMIQWPKCQRKMIDMSQRRKTILDKPNHGKFSGITVHLIIQNGSFEALSWQPTHFQKSILLVTLPSLMTM